MHQIHPHAILRSELEHARDIAKREVPNQKEKHFSRYSGKNESEMSLGYVKKKADSRAGRQQIIDEVFNQPTVTKFDDFIKNKETTETTLKELFDDDAFYISDKTYEDISDVKISKMPDEEKAINNSDGYSCPAFLELDENNAIIGIKVDTNLPKEVIEENIAHEIAHIRQARNPKLKEQLEELNKLGNNISSPKDAERYINHPLEKEANDYASSIVNKKKEYTNGQTNRSPNTVNNDSLTVRSKEERSGRSRNDSMDIPRTPEERSNNSNQPISKQLTSTDGDLDQIEKVVAEVVAKDTK